MELVPIHKLFEVKYGANLELVHLDQCSKEHENAINFVSRTENNNGVSAFVIKSNEVTPNPKHTISVASGGSVLSSFYQEEEYYSGRDIYFLKPIVNLSKLEMLFYGYCLTKNKYKYNYGRQANKTLKDILVPAKLPEKFLSIDITNLNTLDKNKALALNKKLNPSSWAWFRLGDSSLFNITGSKTTSLLELSEFGNGSYPYVTTQATNNGIGGFFDSRTMTPRK